MKSVLKRFNHITEILKEISDLYNEKLGYNLLSIYIRRSVSVGKAKPDISDTDSVAVIKNSYQGRSLFGLSNRQKNWEKIPESRFFDLTVVF